MDEKAQITEREDGPLIVKGLHSFVGTDGNAIETTPVVALCRCGQSKNKPYCDGSHKEAGFKSRGGTAAGRDRVIVYDGEDFKVGYNPVLCSHAAECGRLASNMFNPAQKPWVQPNNGTIEQAREVVAACPSGALTMSDGTTSQHLFADRSEIEIQKDGPYWVTGIDSPVPQLNEGSSAQKYVLCRCGKSGNKPFCDGTHRDEGWTDSD